MFSKKSAAKSGTQEIRFFYLHELLRSTGKILPVYVRRYEYIVAEASLKENVHVEDTERGSSISVNLFKHNVFSVCSVVNFLTIRFIKEHSMNTARAIKPFAQTIIHKEAWDMNWEYSVVKLNVPMFSEQEVLNSLGDNGWELVNVLMLEPGQSTAYFKRLKK